MKHWANNVVTQHRGLTAIQTQFAGAAKQVIIDLELTPLGWVAEGEDGGPQGGGKEESGERAMEEATKGDKKSLCPLGSMRFLT